jgi:hypothetical protein
MFFIGLMICNLYEFDDIQGGISQLKEKYGLTYERKTKKHFRRRFLKKWSGYSHKIFRKQTGV